MGHGKNVNDVSVFVGLGAGLERVFFYRRGNVRIVLVDSMEMRDDDFVGSKVGATQRAAKREPERHCKLDTEGHGKNVNDVFCRTKCRT